MKKISELEAEVELEKKAPLTESQCEEIVKHVIKSSGKYMDVLPLINNNSDVTKASLIAYLDKMKLKYLEDKLTQKLYILKPGISKFTIVLIKVLIKSYNIAIIIVIILIILAISDFCH